MLMKKGVGYQVHFAFEPPLSRLAQYQKFHSDVPSGGLVLGLSRLAGILLVIPAYDMNLNVGGSGGSVLGSTLRIKGVFVNNLK